MNCCPSCFSDRLIEAVISDFSTRKGTCSYCGSENVPLVDPQTLAEHFLPVLDLYESRNDGEGEGLASLFQKNWRVFSSAEFNELFWDIIPDDYERNAVYTLKYNEDDSLINQWERFCQELKHENRYFLQHADRNLLESLLVHLDIIVPEGTSLYRARINQKESKHYKASDLLNPPPILARAGRANPEGISYLYLASNEATALSEVRPQRGDVVTVANFIVQGGLRFIDLRSPYRTFTPFGHEDDRLEVLLFQGLPLLDHLGRELSKPVHIGSSNLDYLPSQYLCELIKSIKFDGIIYESSYGQGYNYVAFHRGSFSFQQSEEFYVKNTSLEFEVVSV